MLTGPVVKTAVTPTKPRKALIASLTQNPPSHRIRPSEALKTSVNLGSPVQPLLPFLFGGSPY